MGTLLKNGFKAIMYLEYMYFDEIIVVLLTYRTIKTIRVEVISEKL